MDGDDKPQPTEMDKLLAVIAKSGMQYAIDGKPADVTAENVGAFVSDLLVGSRKQAGEIQRLNITIDVLTERLASKR